MMSSLVLEHKTFVAVDATEHTWLFDGPVANVSPLFLAALLLCVRRLPSAGPVIGELFQEGRLERRGLGTC